jgi:preprotein translocase subunit SecY
VLSGFASAFRTPDLRNKLLFTLAIIVIYRLGASVPTPNTNTAAINACLKQANNSSARDVYSLINLFSGGALLRLSVFALSIVPYITASIIIQLLVVVIPRFEALRKEGQSGQLKLTQYSRYLTIGLASPPVHRLRGPGPDEHPVPELRPGRALQAGQPRCARDHGHSP